MSFQPENSNFPWQMKNEVMVVKFTRPYQSVNKAINTKNAFRPAM